MLIQVHCIYYIISYIISRYNIVFYKSYKYKLFKQVETCIYELHYLLGYDNSVHIVK